MSIASGYEPATTAEVDAIAEALLVDLGLLQRQIAEYELDGRAGEMRERLARYLGRDLAE